LKRVILLVLLLIVVGGVYFFRGTIREAWRNFRGIEEAVASPELAEIAGSKLDALRDGSKTYVALSAAELQSLLLYRYQGVVPAFIESPQIELDGDQLRLRGRVPVDKLPDVQGLSEAAAFLPDTADLLVEGRILPLSGGRAAFAVDGVTAAKLPLPSALVPRALARLGRRDEPGLPRDAIALPLPAGIASAYIRRDSLVLITREN
jgi:hypothetical protein